MKKRTYKFFVILAILVIVITASIAGYSAIKKHVPKKNSPFPSVSDLGNGGATTYVPSDKQDENGETVPEGSYFTISFFDVGEGDSTLVECDGHYMLVDGGNPSESRFLYSYLEKHGINYLDYIICTHAHEDHVGGLAGALNYASVGTAYCPVTEFDTRAFNSFVKYLGVQGKEITVPQAGDSFNLGSATVQIIGPVDMSLAEDNENNTSIVLRIKYGETSFLITGDAEEAEELSIVRSRYDLRSTVLRVGHHGSYTSTSEDFIKAVKPEYCVISVGEGNSYGHPHDVVLERIKRYGESILRTDLNGDIVFASDGKDVTYTTEK